MKLKFTMACLCNTQVWCSAVPFFRCKEHGFGDDMNAALQSLLKCITFGLGLLHSKYLFQECLLFSHAATLVATCHMLAVHARMYARIDESDG